MAITRCTPERHAASPKSTLIRTEYWTGCLSKSGWDDGISGLAMNASNRTTCDDVSELRAALEVMLSEHFGRPLRVDHFERRPFAYQTSSAIEAIDVELDGTRLKLLLKDLSRSGLQGTALRTKPDFVRHPLREIEVYRKIL